MYPLKAIRVRDLYTGKPVKTSLDHEINRFIQFYWMMPLKFCNMACESAMKKQNINGKSDGLR